MPFIPDADIEDSEILFRAIHPSHWDEDEERPTSAAFKDRQGVSVDRDGERSTEDCLSFLLNNRNSYGACSIKADLVNTIGAYAKKDQKSENIFHALILKKKKKIHLSNGKARALSKAADIHVKPVPEKP